VRLHLGQVVVRAGAALDQLGGVVEEVQPEIKQAARHGLAVDGKVLLLEVPAARAADERRQAAVGAQAVPLVALLEVDLAADGVVQVELAVDHVVPGRRGGVLEVGHVGPHVRVEGVDDHLAVDGAGDLDAAVDQARGRKRALPDIALADVLGLGQKIGQDAAVELGLADHAALEELLAAGVEGAVQQREEDGGIFGQDLFGFVVERAEDEHLLEDGFGVCGHG
jgi:hypothetical protein